MNTETQSTCAGGNAIPANDLLKCLMELTIYFGKPFSENALTAGLPIEQDGLTPELFSRAAKHAGIDSEQQNCTLENVDLTRLPAILLTKNNQAILLVAKNEQCYIMQTPENNFQDQEIPQEELQQIYDGSVIYAEPSFDFTQRTQEVTTTSSQHWFLSTLKEAIPVYGEVLLASFLVNIFALASPLFVMNVYDRVVPNSATDTLWVLASGIAIVVFFDVLLRTLRAYFIDAAGKHVDLKLSAKIFAHALGIPMQKRPNSVGAFVNSVQGFESFRDFITSSTTTILVDLPFVLLYIAVIAIIGGALAWVPIIAIPVVIGVGYFFMKPLKLLTEESNKHAAEKQATLIETLGAAETVKCEQAEGSMQRRWELMNRLSAQTGIKLRLYSNSALHFAIFVQQIAYILVVIWGVYKIADHQMTTGGLIACTILASRALAYMSQVAGLMTRYNQAMTAMQSIAKIMDLPVERPQGSSLLQRKFLHGDIEFRHVGFNYPGQPTPALQDISFKIKAGEHVGIIGRIGSGKTTLAKLLLGLYQPEQGMILMDGAELRQIDTADLRRNIGYVPQDIVLFFGTVKENIRFGKTHVSDEVLLKSASIAGVDRFLSQHPQGFEMQVGERGGCLSGGQRQAIALSRALLEDPSIVILDEPTNSMDDGTESYVRTKLAEAVAYKTFILVTHKGSMLSLVDRLIVMDDGRVVADGPKDVVLNALKEGKVKVTR